MRLRKSFHEDAGVWIAMKKSGITMLLCRAFVACYCIFMPSAAMAFVTNLTASANTSLIPFGQTATVTINWSMQSNSGIGTPDTVFSDFGEFYGQTLLGTRSVRLAQGIVAAGHVPVPVTFREILQIPSSIIYQASKNGSVSINYQRTFTDGTGSAVGSITLNIGSPGGGILSVSRIELRFDNEKIVHIAGKDEKLTAVAEVNYTGTGLLVAEWQAADTTSTFGESVFVPLRQIRQYLGSGHTAIFQSPVLPTASSGDHLIKLVISQPVVSFEQPALTYYVNTSKSPAISHARGTSLRLQSPEPQAFLSAATEFRWQAVEGARAYQLELHDDEREPGERIPAAMDKIDMQPEPASPDGRPVTGILIPAGRTYASLSVESRQYLQGGRNYLWRVIAIGSDGSVLATSSLQEIYVP